jgi:hypothetical protein
MSTTATTIIAECAKDLLDVTKAKAVAYTHWSEAEWLTYLNDAEKEIVGLKHDAYIVDESVVLVAGIKQSIPSGGIQLIKVTCNMGVSPGTTPGAAITLVGRDILDAISPSWATETAAATVVLYMYDIKNPLNFYVSPPQPSSGFGYVAMAYAKVPTKLASTATAINLGDEYIPALKALMKSYAYAKDSDSSPDSATMSINWYKKAMAALGQMEQIEAADDPNK